MNCCPILKILICILQELYLSKNHSEVCLTNSFSSLSRGVHENIMIKACKQNLVSVNIPTFLSTRIKISVIHLLVEDVV